MATTKPSEERTILLVEKLGLLKAEISRLEKRETELKEEIVASGYVTAESDHYKLVVTKSQRESLDMKAVREHLSPQFITAHTYVTEVVTVRITERKD